MIKIVEGGFFSGAHQRLKEEILSLVNEGKRCYLIVPEQQTVTAEEEMAELLPGFAPLHFEVTNFTRLANTVFRALGGVDAEYADKTRRALIMWRALTELSPTLSMTGGGEVSTGTVSRALAATSQMQSLAIDPEELSALEERIPTSEGRLSAKVRDLSRIMALYKKLLNEKYADAAGDVAAMTERLRENPDFFGNTTFYIEGFSSFTEPQYRFIAELARICEVSLYLAIPRSAPDAFEFSELCSTKARILRLCDLAGVEKRLLRIDGLAGNEFLYECSKLLWRTSGKIDNISLQNKEELRIFECPTPYEECDFVAADIRTRVKNGASYRDFAVIARSAEKYIGIIDTAFSKVDIPYFISKKRSAEAFEAVKLIYTAFSVIAGGFRREDVISYAKCTPSGITREECDEFEAYTEKWQITGSRFHDGMLWNMNPDGYTTRKAPDYKERLLAINETRERLIEPLSALDMRCREAGTVREYTLALVRFFEDIGLEGAIAKRAGELASLGEAELATECAGLFDIICSALDTMVSTLGDAPCGTDGFISQLRVVFANTEVGRIPTFYDSVTIGSADMLRLVGKKHIYLIGVNRTEFPMTVSESGYFSERDRATLCSLGAKIEPEGEISLAREMFFFSRALSYAKDSATILYVLRGAGLSDTKRSELVDRIEEMTDGKIRAQDISKLPSDSLLYSPEVTLENLGKLDTPLYLAASDALCEAGFADRVRVAEGKVENDALSLSPSVRALLYGGPLSLTQSRIDVYNSCPLSYFLTYNLSLSPEERAEFDMRNIGSFIHAILESFFSEVLQSKKDLDTLDIQTQRQMVERGARAYLALVEEEDGMRTARDEVLLQRLCRAAMPVVSGLCDEFRGSGFLPRYFELSIGGEREDLPEAARFVSDEGGEVYIYGSIDRVDTFTEGGEVYVRVVDYKTGRKDFSPSDIDEGRNLQMFLYLKSIVDTRNENFLRELGVKEGGHPIPAGVIYVKTEIGDTSAATPDEECVNAAVAAAQKRKGMILDEPAVLAATNVRYNPVRILKSGSIHKSDLDRAYSREGWEAICDRIGNVIGGIAGKMRSGDISASPKDNDACSYCKYKFFCRSTKS